MNWFDIREAARRTGVGLLVSLPMLCRCGGQPLLSAYDLPRTTYEGTPLTVCEASHLVASTFLASSHLGALREVRFPSRNTSYWMTGFDLSDIEMITGSPVKAPATALVRGGITYSGDSYAGPINAVLDGGAGVWFCEVVDGNLVVLGDSLMSQAADGRFYGAGYYRDAGVTLADIRTMVAWPECDGGAFP